MVFASYSRRLGSSDALRREGIRSSEVAGVDEFDVAVDGVEAGMVEAYVDAERCADVFGQARFVLPLGLPGGGVAAERIAEIEGVAGQRVTFQVRQLDAHLAVGGLDIEQHALVIEAHPARRQVAGAGL